MIKTDMGFHFLRAVSFFLSLLPAVLSVSLWCVHCSSSVLRRCCFVCTCQACTFVCVRVRVIGVKCWCLVNCSASLKCIYALTHTDAHTHTHTHTRQFDLLSQRCAVSPPGSTLRTTTQQLHPIPLFLRESLLPSSPSRPLPPFSLLSFYFLWLRKHFVSVQVQIGSPTDC